MKKEYPWEGFSTQFTATELSFENARLRSINTKQINGSALRVIKDGKLGFLVNTSAQDQKVTSLYDQALELAELGAEFYADFYMPRDTYPACNTFDPQVGTLTSKELIDLVMQEINLVQKACSTAKVDAGILKSEGEVVLENKYGLRAHYKKSNFTFFIGAEIIEETSFFFTYQMFARTSFEKNLRPWTQRLIEHLSLSRKNIRIPTGTYQVMFTPRAAAELVFILKNALDGNNIYRKISPLTGKIGDKVFDERFSLIDDGTVEKSPVSAPCDDEGVPMYRSYLVDRGVVTGILTDLDSAAKLKQEPSGNGIRCRYFVGATKDYSAPPCPTPTNWSVSGGNVHHKELLSNEKKVILIDQMMGLFTGNLLNGDFSGNILVGYVIENGKVVGRVKDCMVSGNIYTMLSQQLHELSSDTEDVDSNGVHTFPYMLFKDVSIAAK